MNKHIVWLIWNSKLRKRHRINRKSVTDEICRGHQRTRRRICVEDFGIIW